MKSGTISTPGGAGSGSNSCFEDQRDVELAGGEAAQRGGAVGELVADDEPGVARVEDGAGLGRGSEHDASPAVAAAGFTVFTLALVAGRLVTDRLVAAHGRRRAHRARGALHWLQSLDDGAPALPVADPWQFLPGYEIQLSDDDTARIGAADEVDVWVTVRAGGVLSDFSANLRAPILIANGLGHQVINEAADAPVRAALFAQEPAEQAAQRTTPCSSSRGAPARRSWSATT